MELKNKDNELKNHRNLFLSLRKKDNDIVFDILNDSDEFKWKYIDSKHLISSDSNDKCIWSIIDDKFLMNNEGFYISCNLDYKILLTQNKKEAIPFQILESVINYIKPTLRLNFEINNYIYNIDINDLYNKLIIKSDKNIGLLLSGGFSRRFGSDILKQMYYYKSIPLFIYSLKILVNTLDMVLIVTNSFCFNDIKKIIENDDDLKKNKIYITINDIGDRLESIDVGLYYIKNVLKESISNLIIHDACRPFIKEKHIKDLLFSDSFYSQYYFNLTNGLLKKNNDNYEEVNRDEYIEICTPICIHFALYDFLFSNYMKKERRILWEIVPLLDLLKIKYELLEGDYKYIRKITIKKDLEDI